MQQPIYIHLISAVLVLCFIIFLVLQGLDSYTLHNKAIVVPDVKGLLIEEASIFLRNSGLRYEVVDSVYSKEVKPGAIQEMIPPIGSKVKKGRTIYITLNAKNAQSAAIPDVKNLSFRQGYALIKAQGFLSVETKYVSGPFKDLVIGVELNGKELSPGELVPLTAALILKVSNGGKVTESEETATVNEN